jgi:hypothetical protein
MAAVFVVTFLLAGVVGPAALALLVAYLAFLYVRDYRRGRADVRRLELKLRERVDSEGITPKLIEDLDNTEIIYGRRTVRKLSARLGIPNN